MQQLQMSSSSLRPCGACWRRFTALVWCSVAALGRGSCQLVDLGRKAMSEFLRCYESPNHVLPRSCGSVWSTALKARRDARRRREKWSVRTRTLFQAR